MASDELAVAAPAPSEAEISSVARRLAASYEANLRFRMRDLHETAEDADRVVRQAYGPDRHEEMLNEPSDQVSWFAISSLIEADPEAGWGVWERVKAEAAEELASGHRAAQAICWDDSPWQRAQFLAIRQAFIDEWRPRGGIETTLIDQMSQAHLLWLHWVERAHVQASIDGAKQKRDIGQNGRWQVRTLGVAETLDQSAQMAERWQKLFVRALRALRDLRRHAPPVVLAAPGSQVNVGQQQVNVTGAPGNL